MAVEVLANVLGLSLDSFRAVSQADGFEVDIPHFRNHHAFKNIYYGFRLTDDKVRDERLVNILRVRLYGDDGCVAVYELKTEPLVYLVEVWKDRGKKTYLEIVKLRYYDFGSDEPQEEPMGYIKVGSHSVIGLISEKKACELIEKLIKHGWRVGL